MKRCTLGCIAIFALSGCYSSSHFTPAGGGSDLSYGQFNDRLTGEDATIALGLAHMVEGEALSVGPDTLSWTDPGTHLRVNASLDSVRYLYTRHHGVPTLIGLGAGAAFGVVVAAIGAGGDHHDGDMKGFFWVIGPPAGAVLGAGIGAIVGRTNYYDFTPRKSIGTPEQGK